MLNLEQREKLKQKLDITAILLGLVSLCNFLFFFGFYLTNFIENTLTFITYFLTFIFIILELIKIFGVSGVKNYIRTNRFEIILIILLLFLIVDNLFQHNLLNTLLIKLHIPYVHLISMSIINFLLFFSVILKALRYNYLLRNIKLHPGAIFTISFFILILCGTVLLLLPKATYEGQRISIIDALFTSTSAVCVTGLIVVDTATKFTYEGQLIILFLIQVGGLGIMTFTTFFAIYFGGSASIYLKIMMKDFLSEDNIGKVSFILIRILIFTFVIEAIGVLLIYYGLNNGFSSYNPENLFVSIFHSVSAFCNAGFSLFSENAMNEKVINNYIITNTIMLLIILGGLGFTVLNNIFNLRPKFIRKKRIRNQLSIHSKIVLLTTLILIFGGALMILISEINNPKISSNFFRLIYDSLFQSVSARTAGFNTVNIELLTAPTALIIIILMWIGASPGGTGGGIKTTTFSLAVLSFLNIIKGKSRTDIFNRTVTQESIQKSYLVIFGSMSIIILALLLISWMEPDKNLLDLAFEVVSAFGTVGLSRNVTFHLGDGGKLIITLLMFIGRIGILTFVISFFAVERYPKYGLPKENVIVG
ncbi:MAG: hypothetical protein N2319_01355 [Candidatus Kapabacteria bacterium]|nr:hypothetical protein [Candidatus Kapabacteria bacterium]